MILFVTKNTGNSDDQINTAIQVEATTSQPNGGSAEKSQVEVEDTPDDDVDNENYEVENIVAHKIKDKKRYFKIKWKGYPTEQNTWEPEGDLNCNEILTQYLEKHPKADITTSAKKSQSQPNRSVKRKLTPKSKEESNEQSIKRKKNDTASTSSEAAQQSQPISTQSNSKR